MNKVNESWSGKLSSKGYMQMSWTVGYGSNKLSDVCRALFIHCYFLSHSFLDRCCKDVKNNLTNPNKSNLNDHCNNFSDQTEESKITSKEITLYTEKYGLTLTTQQLAALKLPNKQLALITYGWMEYYFNLVGDCQPNRNAEIHLEPTTIGSIYYEYCDEIKDMQNINTQYESYSFPAFCKFWKDYFPHVKVREFKAVAGKCNVCCKLSELRKSSRHKFEKQQLTLLHQLHRSAYMNERMAYNVRKSEGCTLGHIYLSIITDGMAQTHCELPHLGQQGNFSHKMKQHLQGVLVHGRGMFIFRTFHTIQNSANLQIHTMLLTLEEIRRKEGTLPIVFYYQIDGAVENVANVVIAACEYLVSRNIVSKIVLSRLIVGHTHEDIDAKFGTIWTYIRNQNVLTPQQYKVALEQCLKKKNSDHFIHVYDLFAIPDYAKFLKPFVDTKFGLYCKEEQTQHQFIFEKVLVDENFPLGVKTTYRAYSADQVIEIIEDAAELLKLRAVNVVVKTYPTAEATGSKVDGMYILQKLPDSDLKPLPFLKPEDGDKDLIAPIDRAIQCLRKYIGTNKPEYIDEWVEFKKFFPVDNESVESYIEK
jgi:hypothetical protein